jgi:hypothetical protein
MASQPGSPGIPIWGSNAFTTAVRSAPPAIFAWVFFGSRIRGTSQRSSGIAYASWYPAASGTSSGCTYAGSPQCSANRRVAPEWSRCRWVNTIDAGRALGTNTDSAAAPIFFSLPNQPASTNVQEDPERIR